jgi:hypothetical protein
MLRVGIVCLAVCAGLVITGEALEHHHVYMIRSCMNGFGTFYLLMMMLSFCVAIALTAIGLTRWVMRRYR